MPLFHELKRRNVFRVGIVYLGASWLLLQVTDLLMPILNLPETAKKLVFLLLLIGFIPALILAWAFELTPEGIKREKEVDRNQSITSRTGRKLDFAIIAILVIALGYFAWDKFAEKGSAEKGSEPFSNNAAHVSSAEEEKGSDPFSADPFSADPFSAEKSIAVLPFANMSSDPEQEYFSDGLAEELLNRLAQRDDLRVAARTSAFQFRGKNLDVSDIGKQLNVETVLEGSVRKSGNRLRITAQLINVKDGFHLWSETYERELTDIFVIQDEIAAAIAGALELELGTTGGEQPAQLTSNLEAYNLYLQARFLFAGRTEESMLQAIELFQQAVALDPKFSKAWSGLAVTYSLMPVYGATISAAEGSEKTLQYANTAIALDAGNAEAWVARGRVEGTSDWSWAASAASFERAFALAPNDGVVVNMLGDSLTWIGDFVRSEKIERRAIELDPLAAFNHHDLGVVLLILNRNKEALEVGHTSAKLGAGRANRMDVLISALIRLGDFSEARKQIELAENMPYPDPELVSTWWCQYYFEQNDVVNLRRVLAERAEQSNLGNTYMLHTTTAFYTLWLDGVDAALPWLEKAYQQHEYLLTWPLLVYLPERISTDAKWLEFWNRPGLKELMDIRRANGPYEHIGYWKERVSP